MTDLNLWIFPRRGERHSSLFSADSDDEHDQQLRNAFAMISVTNSTRMRFHGILHSIMRPYFPRERRVGRVPRPSGGIWDQMEQVWDDLPGTMTDEKYYEYFRMNKTAFDDVYETCKGAITSIV